MNARKWSLKAILVLLVLAATFYGVRLLLLAADCRDEVVSMQQFDLQILGIEVEADHVAVALGLKNPSAKTVRISYVLCEVRFNGDRIGVYLTDLIHSPIVIEGFSEQSKVVSIPSEKIRGYEGMQVDVQVLATIKIGISYFKGVALDDTYDAQITLHLP